MTPDCWFLVGLSGLYLAIWAVRVRPETHTVCERVVLGMLAVGTAVLIAACVWNMVTGTGIGCGL